MTILHFPHQGSLHHHHHHHHHHHCFHTLLHLQHLLLLFQIEFIILLKIVFFFQHQDQTSFSFKYFFSFFVFFSTFIAIMETTWQEELTPKKSLGIASFEETYG